MSEADTSIEAFERHIAVTKSGRTAQTYARGANKLVQFMQETSLSEDPALWPQTMLDDWVAWMANRDLAGRTIKLMTVGGRLYLKFWRKRDSSVPDFETPAIPKIKPKNPVVLGTEALRNYIDLIDEEENDPLRTALILLPLTGLRSEEMVTMTMSRITIQPDPDEPNRVWVLFDVRGKGDKRRIVPLLQEANFYLREYLGGWRASRRQGEDWLFPGGIMGRHLTTRALRDRLVEFRRRHQIHQLTPHNLRATYLTLLDRHGISSLTVAQLAGHLRPEGRTELQTLRKHYVHHDVPDLMRALAEVRV
jgi:site-specific recombinase XerD